MQKPATATTTPALPVKEIVYDRETGDFALYLDGELVGFARSHLDGEQALDTILAERGKRGRLAVAEQAAAQVEAEANYGGEQQLDDVVAPPAASQPAIVGSVAYSLTRKQIRVFWCDPKDAEQGARLYPRTPKGRAAAERCIARKMREGYANVGQWERSLDTLASIAAQIRGERAA